MPDAKSQRFTEQYALSRGDASALTSDIALAAYFEEVVKFGGDSKLATNWIMGELSGQLNKEHKSIGDSPVSAEMLGGLLARIQDDTISGKIAKQVFEAMWAGEGSADAIIEAKGLKQITDTGAIEKIVREVIDANPKQVEQFKGGQDKLLGFFVGQVMKASQGKANPGEVNKLIKKILS